MPELKPGLAGESSQVVTDAQTAAVYGSGFVPAYATPAMIALMENAGATAMQPCLAPGQTSVGVEVNVKHLAATPVGMTVRARAELLAVEGRRVTFKVEAWDDQEMIGEGTHMRAVIDDARFRERLAAKSKQ
ncbi:MAG: thioesterase family protein [Chloroflexi bacterium]|nr:thioesterase family protein [Chloroflexota bacterium]